MKQIKSCLKNLLVNLKYYFVPLGICMFFIVIGVSVGIPIILESIKSAFNSIAAELGGVEFNWNNALSRLIEKINEIDGSRGINAYIEAFNQRDWLINTLIDVARALFGDSINTEAIIAMIGDCAKQIEGTLTYILTMAIAGFGVAFLTIMVAARKSSAKIDWIKAVLFSILDTVLFIGFSWIYLKFNPTATWVKVIVNISYCIGVLVISFVEAYFFYAFKKIPFKKVFNLKNIVFLVIGNIMTFLIGVGLTIIPIAVVPWYGGIVLAVPLIEIVFLVVHMNYEVYTKELVLEEKHKDK